MVSGLWKIRNELVVVAIAVLMQFFGARPLKSMVEPLFASPVVSESILYMISVGLALSVIYLAHKGGCVAPIKFFSDDGTYKLIIVGAIGITAASYISTGIIIGLSAFVESDLLQASNVSADSWNYSLIEKFFSLVVVAVGAPIIEEIIFRGAFLGAMNKTRKTGKAVIITSVIFGLLHRISILAVLTASLTGVVLAYIYLASGSLLCSIWLHSAVNLAVNVKAFWLTNEVSVEGIKESITAVIALSDMQLAALFVAVGKVFAIVFVRVIRRRMRV